MTTSCGNLPTSDQLDVSPLVKSMRNVTNSYKHLFLRAILKLINETDDCAISYERLFYAMIEEAWWPAFHYRLSLGKQDKVCQIIDQSFQGKDDLRVRPGDVPGLVKTIPFDLKRERSVGILRYVPQRLIAPWFPEINSDAKLGRASIESFEDAKPLYKVEESNIVVHPEWASHLRRWNSVFTGWSDASWIAFLESRNPHALSLFVKVKPAFERTPLVSQRRIWSEASTFCSVKCIYTNKSLASELFELDHFFPHTFVGHDRFWNLTPTFPSINLEKRDRFPNEAFVDGIAGQHATLHSHRSKLSSGAQRDLDRVIEEYAVDLGISASDLLSREALRNAYNESFKMLGSIADRMGFTLGWRPSEYQE